jgi:hypothetical protein
VRFHIEMNTERNIRLGMTPGRPPPAQIEFGARALEGGARDVFRRPLWEDLQGFPTPEVPGRHVGFALTVTLTQARHRRSTAIFSVVNASCSGPCRTPTPTGWR